MVSRAHTAGARFLPDKDDPEETARVYQEFIETFQNEPKPATQSWVRGGVVNSDPKNSKTEAPKLYKPVSRFEPVTKPKAVQNKLPSEPVTRPIIKKKEEKKKSNLELFKEELKRMQEQREFKNQMKKSNVDPISAASLAGADGILLEGDTDSITTNLFVGNLQKTTTEQDLIDVFGRYGTLASVKIMAPRPEENKPFVKNCGFVAYMNRQDCERAMNKLRGKELHGNEIKLGWGKPVPMPPFPIHVPETLFEMLRPPQPSGLPFNAQPRDWLETEFQTLVERVKPVKDGVEKNILPIKPRSPYDIRKMSRVDLNELLTNCVVKVTIPTDRAMLILIHRTIEFVILEGPEFEAAIIHKEQANPIYRFLYDYNCPEHVYYRWKLWSLLHGETSNSWCTDEFKMFLSGPWWRPPPVNFFANPMPEELILEDALTYAPNFNKADPLYTMYDAERDRMNAISQSNMILTDDRRRRLNKLLRTIEPTVNGIGRVMLWCLKHAESAEDIVRVILKSLDPEGFDDEKLVPLPVLVGRVYLISDILYNSCAKAPNASAYRKILERHLPDMFSFLNKHYCILIDESQTIKLKGEQLKQKVLLCLRAWHDWAIYPNDFLQNIRDIFLGVPKKSEEETKSAETPEHRIKKPRYSAPAGLLVQYDDDEDDNEVDGKPLDLDKKTTDGNASDDSDGVPLDNVDLSKPIGAKIGFNPLAPEPTSLPHSSSGATPTSSSSLFIKSKWETLDEETIESESQPLSNRWELFNANDAKAPMISSQIRGRLGNSNESPGAKSDVDGQPLNSSEFNLVAYDDDDISSGPDDIDGKPLGQMSLNNNTSQGRREPKIDRDKLREIEVRVMKYQDELETARRQNKSSHISQKSFEEQVKKYRDRLIDSALEKSGSDKDSKPSSRNGRDDSRSKGSSSSSRKRSKRPNDDDSSSDDSSRKKSHRNERSRSSSRGRNRSSRPSSKSRKR